MAQRRMFAKTIIDSDAFLDMPLSAQSLYFHLSMRADDDGFVNNPRKIQRMIGSNDDELKLLITKRFIIVFESGVIVIKHWKIHNYIRADRYKETVYQEEYKQLTEKPNKSYRLINDPKNGIPTVNQPVNQPSTNRQSDVSPIDVTDTAFDKPKHDNTKDNEFGIPNDNQQTYQMDTQVRLGKDRLGKDRLITTTSSSRVKTNVFEFYQDNIGVLSNYVHESLDYWIDDISSEVVLEAIKVSLEQGKATYSYINGILKNWKSRNVKSINDVNALKAERENQKKQQPNAYTKQKRVEEVPEHVLQQEQGIQQEITESPEEVAERQRKLDHKLASLFGGNNESENQ